MSEHTPGPWSACGDGNCQCKTVGGADHPIAKVYAGEWGDDYPAVRLVGESSLEHRAEAYMERIPYGLIPEETARANARLISKAWLLPEMVEALRIAAAGYEEMHGQEIGCPECEDDVSCAGLLKVREALQRYAEASGADPGKQ